jgi:hypothetical protein
MQITRLYKGREHVEVEFIVSEADGCLILLAVFSRGFTYSICHLRLGPYPLKMELEKKLQPKSQQPWKPIKHFTQILMDVILSKG